MHTSSLHKRASTDRQTDRQDRLWVKWNWFIHLWLHMELRSWNDLKWIEVTGAATEIEPIEAERERDADCHQINVSVEKMSATNSNQIYHKFKSETTTWNLTSSFVTCQKISIKASKFINNLAEPKMTTSWELIPQSHLIWMLIESCVMAMRIMFLYNPIGAASLLLNIEYKWMQYTNYHDSLTMWWGQKHVRDKSHQ